MQLWRHQTGKGYGALLGTLDTLVRSDGSDHTNQGPVRPIHSHRVGDQVELRSIFVRYASSMCLVPVKDELLLFSVGADSLADAEVVSVGGR